MQANYNKLIADLNANRVRLAAISASQKDGTVAAIIAGASTAGTGKSHATDSSATKRAAQLEAELLAVSRDCDALAVRFNSLLRLYQSYQKEGQNYGKD